MFQRHQPDVGGQGQGLHVEKASLVFLSVTLPFWTEDSISSARSGRAGRLPPATVSRWLAEVTGQGWRMKLDSHSVWLCQRLSGDLGKSQTPECCHLWAR